MELRDNTRLAQFLRGELSVSDLDDEEIARGQIRNRSGTWAGTPPRSMPTELVHAMRREFHARAQQKMRDVVFEKGIGTLAELAGNKVIDEGVRLRAAALLLDRALGKVPDKIEVVAEDPLEALFRSVLGDPRNVPHEMSADDREMLS